MCTRTCAWDIDGSLDVLLPDHHTRSPGFSLLLALALLFHVHRRRNKVALLCADRKQQRLRQPHVQQRSGTLHYQGEGLTISECRLNVYLSFCKIKNKTKTVAFPITEAFIIGAVAYSLKLCEQHHKFTLYICKRCPIGVKFKCHTLIFRHVLGWKYFNVLHMEVAMFLPLWLLRVTDKQRPCVNLSLTAIGGEERYYTFWPRTPHSTRVGAGLEQVAFFQELCLTPLPYTAIHSPY